MFKNLKKKSVLSYTELSACVRSAAQKFLCLVRQPGLHAVGSAVSYQTMFRSRYILPALWKLVYLTPVSRTVFCSCLGTQKRTSLKIWDKDNGDLQLGTWRKWTYEQPCRTLK